MISEVEHFAEVQALEGGGALSRFQLICRMSPVECVASRYRLACRARSPNARSFSISGRRGQKTPICESPRLSAGFPEWLERESPGRKSAGMRVRHRAARRRSHIGPILSTATQFS